MKIIIKETEALKRLSRITGIPEKELQQRIAHRIKCAGIKIRSYCGTVNDLYKAAGYNITTAALWILNKSTPEINEALKCIIYQKQENDEAI